MIQEDGVYYVREPEGSLICRISGANTSYYHFDALGSTRLLTDSDGDVTDKYSYDAYGSLIAHDEFTGSVDQPYQYVGQLGYYTHWQEPEFELMQLGVRFCDPEVGRFSQRDPIKDDRLASYVYARNRATRVVDPDGRQATTYPTLVGSSACNEFNGMDSFIREAQRYVADIVDALSLERCPSTITVNCYKKDTCWLFWKNRECGKSVPNSGGGAHMHINLAPQCSSPKCLILHELVHTCGMTAHKWYGTVTIPGCSGVGFGP